MHIQATTKDAYQLLHRGVLAFARAERRGFRIDLQYCNSKINHLTHQIKRLEQDFESTKFFTHWKHVYGTKANLYSDQQLSHILYNVRKLKPVKSTKGGTRGSTDIESLQKLNIPELKNLIEIGKLSKLVDYLDGYAREQVDSVVHPFYNLHLAKTFRSSSSNPNQQNVPIRDETAMNIVRRAIFARLGHQLLESDFSGAEVRGSAAYHQDPRFIDDVLHGDMHKDIAVEVYMLHGLDKKHPGEYNLRQGAKNGFVFPEFYGDYYGNCAPNLIEWAKRATLKDGTPAIVHLSDKGLIRLDKDGNVKNIDRFIDHVKKVEDDFWNVRYRVYTKWKNKWWAQYQKRGYIELLTGFICKGVMSKNDCINYPIQGTAFHCLLWCFIRIDEISIEENWDSQLIGQVHDSMITDTEPSELSHVYITTKRVTSVELQQAWPWLVMPMDVDFAVTGVDESWNKKVPLKLAA
jgi:DNA polymerase I-like protein with 3'-5' exonuclease and polymerase domains